MSIVKNEQQVNEGIYVEKYFDERGNKPSVYNESELQLDPYGITRVWISFDIEEDPNKERRKALYDWFNTQTQIESWGNSVATFLATGYVDLNRDLAECLVSELQNAKVLNSAKWEETPGISLYITYESRKVVSRNAGHFVLIQNAKIMQPSGFKC